MHRHNNLHPISLRLFLVSSLFQSYISFGQHHFSGAALQLIHDANMRSDTTPFPVELQLHPRHLPHASDVAPCTRRETCSKNRHASRHHHAIIMFQLLLLLRTCCCSLALLIPVPSSPSLFRTSAPPDARMRVVLRARKPWPAAAGAAAGEEVCAWGEGNTEGLDFGAIGDC